MAISLSIDPKEKAKLEKYTFAKEVIYPYRGHEFTKEMKEKRDHMIQALAGVSLTLMTEDKRKIDACWVEQAPSTPMSAVLFHGNGMKLFDSYMKLLAQYFKKKNVNVLLITMGGYPGSEGKTNELTTYHDVAAAVNHVMQTANAKPENIVAYGRSLGSALAIQAGAHFGVHVIAELPFEKISTKYLGPISTLFSKSAIKKGFPKGISDGSYTTNAYNNKEKAETMAGKKAKLAVLYAKSDEVINFPQKQAAALSNVYREKNPTEQDSLLIELKGGHNKASFFKDEEALQKIDTFVLSCLVEGAQ